MNKRFIVSAVVLFVVSMALGFVVHALLLMGIIVAWINRASPAVH